MIQRTPFAVVVVASSLTALSPGCDPAPTIAPNCETSVCAEVDVSAALTCRDDILEIDFTMATNISGRVDQTSCGVDDVGGGQDLSITVGPVDPGSEETSFVSFRLRNYKGPGTYPLSMLEEEGNFTGLELHGNNTVPDGVGSHDNSVGTVYCKPVICEATVAEGSEPIPNDPSTVHDFRLRVDIACPSGGILTDFNVCDDPPTGTTCTLDAAPTLKLDLVCAN